MYIKINNLSYILLKSLIHPTFWLMLLFSNFEIAIAGKKFISKSPCADTKKVCVKGAATKIIDGFEVYKDCWEWSYTKTCKYPSKNNCAQYEECYSLGERDCILRDSTGSCVNMSKEFSCKRWTPVVLESETVRYGTEDRDGAEGLICEGIPCIDGNCVDKSYQMDADMVSSVALLGALSQGKSDGVNFKIFEGLGRHCSKKNSRLYKLLSHTSKRLGQATWC